MKKLVLAAALAIILCCSSVFADGAVGSAFGTFGTAHSLGMGNGNALVGVGIGDDRNVLLGRINYGLSRFTDGSIKLALVDPDGQGSSTRIAVGADFMYQFMVMDEVTRSSFEMGAGGMFEYYDLEHGSALLIGANLLGSYPFVLDNGKLLTPYGRFGARIERVSFDLPAPLGSTSDTNLEFGLNLGVAWEVTKTVNLYGEFQFDGNDAIFLGAEFDIF
ncbi:MAG: hypothetical protein P1R58_02200 [bacterium]|nr:hypothetical protein [bacterium]